MNRDLDYVLNYMNKYCKDKYMHNSEPMLNSRDIEIILKHIYEIEQENKQLKEDKKKAREYIKELEEDKDIWPLWYEDIEPILEILGGRERK